MTYDEALDLIKKTVEKKDYENEYEINNDSFDHLFGVERYPGYVMGSFTLKIKDCSVFDEEVIKEVLHNDKDEDNLGIVKLFDRYAYGEDKEIEDIHAEGNEIWIEYTGSPEEPDYDYDDEDRRYGR